MSELEASINNIRPTVQEHRPRPPAESPVQTGQATTANRGTLGARLGAFLFSVLVIGMIYSGWVNRENDYLTAESGLGYGLGIIGGVLMLILLLYPARKRFRIMRHLGPVKYWFRGHMMLGIIGPSCILFHANFQLGSLNSNVALICMLLVAGSGVIGRYIYTQIHYGLYGGKASLEQLRQDKTDSAGQLAATFALPTQVQQRLQAYENNALSPAHGFFHSILRRFALAFRSHWTYFISLYQLRHALMIEARQKQSGRAAYHQRYTMMRRYLSAYFSTIQKITVFSFYEKLFSLWHVLHLPLFLMMLISGIVHVVAVHMY